MTKYTFTMFMAKRAPAEAVEEDGYHGVQVAGVGPERDKDVHVRGAPFEGLVGPNLEPPPHAKLHRCDQHPLQQAVAGDAEDQRMRDLPGACVCGWVTTGFVTVVDEYQSCVLTDVEESGTQRPVGCSSGSQFWQMRKCTGDGYSLPAPVIEQVTGEP